MKTMPLSMRNSGLPTIVTSLWFPTILLFLATSHSHGADLAPLPGAKPLTGNDDLSSRMVAGIDRYLTKAAIRAIKERDRFWKRDFSSAAAYRTSVAPNRGRFKAAIGAVDERIPSQLEYVAGRQASALVAETDLYRVFAVRWPVFEGVNGEGLLLEPRKSPRAQIVAIPDAGQTPEMVVGLAPGIDRDAQYARRLAEAGCRVIVPMLINRRCTWSGNPDLSMTNQTHREWVYRCAFEMGRHVIGYEVQKVQAMVDWMAKKENARIGVVGYGEGGLIALYTAALDTRIDAALVSGYFDDRQGIWKEPIYRNVFGLLREFGDAEIASLVCPRTLIVEHSAGPKVIGPPTMPKRRRAAAPGDLTPPSFNSVQQEFERARMLCSGGPRPAERLHLVSGKKGNTVGPGSDPALALLLKSLGVESKQRKPETRPADRRKHHDPSIRQRRQLQELVAHSQRLLRRSERIRGDFWKDVKLTKDLVQWRKGVGPFKEYLWEKVLGRMPDPSLPARPLARKLKETAKWTMYEVRLDVWPDVFAWGYLLVPKWIKPSERRPVVVCQHGLEGLPDSVVTEDPAGRGFRSYRAYAVRLAERGFVTFAPHNPYRGETAFRQLQRKANPLGLTLFSFILGQHQRILEWLATLPFVDAKRIGFYGLSYGGTSAMRIPALLDGYALSICSACFNDWTRKIMALDFRSSYMFTREYEQFTFHLGGAFNHAEMAWLIAPRPFMVERGHRDGVAPDEWVAYEYAKVRRMYANLGIPERTTIEFFDGGHVIHGKGTFEFLHRHLKWPKP